MLNLHPRIQKAAGEVHFFDRDENYIKGLEWYRKKMPHSFRGQITIEKSPSYFVTPEVSATFTYANGGGGNSQKKFSHKLPSLCPFAPFNTLSPTHMLDGESRNGWKSFEAFSMPLRVGRKPAQNMNKWSAWLAMTSKLPISPKAQKALKKIHGKFPSLKRLSG